MPSIFFFSLIQQNSLNPNSGSQNRSLLYYMKTQVVSNVQRIKEISHKRYQSRISAVKNFCANKRYKISKVERNNAANLTSRWRQEMWWDVRNGFAWCCVYKVASSSLGNFKTSSCCVNIFAPYKLYSSYSYDKHCWLGMGCLSTTFGRYQNREKEMAGLHD